MRESRKKDSDEKIHNGWLGGVFRDVAEVNRYSKTEPGTKEHNAYVSAEVTRDKINNRRIIMLNFILLILIAYICIADGITGSYGGFSYAKIIICALLFFITVVGTAIYTALMHYTDAQLTRRRRVHRAWILVYWVFYYCVVSFLLLYFKASYTGEIFRWGVLLLAGFLMPVFNFAEMLILLPFSLFELYGFWSMIMYDPKSMLDLWAIIPMAALVMMAYEFTYVERMKTLFTQGMIEQEGVAAQRRMDNIFYELFDIAYEVDLNTDRLSLLRNSGKYSGSDAGPAFSQAIETLAGNGCIYPGDKNNFLKTFSIDAVKNEFKNGGTQIYSEYRRRLEDGEFGWVGALIIKESSPDENEMLVMYLVQDIDARKTSELQMKVEAKKDSLTKLYNKATTRELIEGYLADTGINGMHAFMIIDIDNFKTINDTRGHMVGDEILNEFAKELKRFFRDTDILGRAGGDEFIVFMKNFQTVAMVCDKLQKLTASFKKYGIDHNFAGRLSTSIGVALYSKDGKTYDELFKKADSALYESKNNGKDQYRFV